MALPASRVLERIQKNQLAPAYVLFGTELYWRDRIHAALQKSLELSTTQLGLSEFDLRQDSLTDVLDTARSLSLLSPRQLLFVRNAQALFTRRPKDAADSEGSAGRSDALAEYLGDPNPSSTIVLEMLDADLETDDWRERDKVKSRLESLESSFKSPCEVALLMSPGTGEALELVRAAVAERGRAITPQAAERLVSAFRHNMAVLQMELEKASLFDPEKRTIDLEDLNQVIAGAAAEVSAGLPDAIGARDSRKALEALDTLKRNGVYAPLLLTEVARYLRQLLLLRQAGVRDPRQGARILWEAKLPAPQSSLPDMVKYTRNFTGTELLHGLELIFQADVALRSSPADEGIVLEQLIMDLIRPSRSSAAAFT